MSNINVSVPVNFKNRRTKERIRLSGLLPGKLYKKDQRNYISCRPFDISENGICILSADYLLVSDIVILEVNSEAIEFTVEWLKPDFMKNGQYRYGLKLLSAEINMIDLFNKTNCLISES